MILEILYEQKIKLYFYVGLFRVGDIVYLYNSYF